MQMLFKMEMAYSVLQSTKVGDFMLSVELKDAYFQVPTHQDSTEVHLLWLKRDLIPVQSSVPWTGDSFTGVYPCFTLVSASPHSRVIHLFAAPGLAKTIKSALAGCPCLVLSLEKIVLFEQSYPRSLQWQLKFCWSVYQSPPPQLEPLERAQFLDSEGGLGRTPERRVVSDVWLKDSFRLHNDIMEMWDYGYWSKYFKRDDAQQNCDGI